MYDGLNSDASAIARAFPNAKYVAGYVDGLYVWSSADWELFPHATHIRISAIPGSSTALTADVADCETGDYTPAQAAAWAVAKRKAGCFRPTIYCNLSTAPAVRAATGSLVLGVDYDMWLADYTGRPFEYTFSDGRKAVLTQFSDAGGFYDESAVYDSGWPHRSAPKPPVPSGPVRHVVPKGNTMSFAALASSRNMREDSFLTEQAGFHTSGHLSDAHYNVLATMKAAGDASNDAGLPRPALVQGTVYYTNG